MSVLVSDTVKVVKTFSTSFFDYPISNENRCEQAMYFIKHLLFRLIHVSVKNENLFNCDNWSGAFKPDELECASEEISQLLYKKDTPALYKELKNLLILFNVTFLLRLNKEEEPYHLQAYYKGMMVDMLNNLPLGRSPALSYRVKGVLFDVLDRSFKVCESLRKKVIE